MEVDVYQKIKVDFGEGAADARKLNEELDAKTKGLFSSRVIRAIIYLANGSVDQLKSTIELARNDWRDVLLQAEYSYPETQRIRDFEKTFHELNLVKTLT